MSNSDESRVPMNLRVRRETREMLRVLAGAKNMGSYLDEIMPILAEATVAAERAATSAKTGAFANVVAERLTQQRTDQQ